jgi:branched-chain amino acid transport system ATP-binding protein
VTAPAPASAETRTGQPLLAVRDLHAHYGESHVLHGLSFDVHPGEVVTLVGRNGAGKTTTLKALMGVNRQKTGEVRLDGRDIGRWPSHRVARAGLAYVPEERGIYASLSVTENLTLPPRKGGGWSLERVYDLFPILKTRGHHPGSKLSGGEQQMLSIARALLTGPRLLLLDEPTEGLAPVIVRAIGEVLRELKREGLTVVLVEQNLRFATRVADRHHLIVNGRIVETLSNDEVRERQDELLHHLGV